MGPFGYFFLRKKKWAPYGAPLLRGKVGGAGKSPLSISPLRGVSPEGGKGHTGGKGAHFLLFPFHFPLLFISPFPFPPYGGFPPKGESRGLFPVGPLSPRRGERGEEREMKRSKEGEGGGLFKGPPLFLSFFFPFPPFSPLR